MAPRLMDLGNLRRNGCRSVSVICRCGRNADVVVDQLPDHIIVVEAYRRMRCTVCGERPISSRPDTLAWNHGRRN